MFKSKNSNEISANSYEIVIICKMAKDIKHSKNSLKLLLTFTSDIRIYFRRNTCKISINKRNEIAVEVRKRRVLIEEIQDTILTQFD